MKLPLLLILILAIGAVVGAIILDVSSVETAPEVENPVFPPAPEFLESFSKFTAREIPVKIVTETVYKQSPALSLSLLYSPFTQKIGFSSSISFPHFTVGIVYTDSIYISAGVSLTL